MSNIIKVENLIEIEESGVITTFCDKGQLVEMVSIISQAVSVDNESLATDKSRKEIASRAHKVSKIKTSLVKVLDTSLTETKALIKNATDGKKYLVAELDTLRDKTRKSLTDWEVVEKEKEEKRVNDIKCSIQGIIELSYMTHDQHSNKNHIAEMIEAVDNIDCSNGFDEFAEDALKAKIQAKENLSSVLTQLIQKELEEKQRLEFEAKAKELEDKEKELAAREECVRLEAARLEAEAAPATTEEPEPTPVQKLESTERLHVQGLVKGKKPNDPECSIPVDLKEKLEFIAHEHDISKQAMLAINMAYGPYLQRATRSVLSV